METKDNIDVSVIVTVYNIKDYIGACLDSILNQEGISLELICVDDVSTDGSYEILCEYARKDNRVKVYRNEVNRGLSSTRNVGIRHASGKYFYNIDGDDLLKPGSLRRLFTCAEENKLDLLSFSAESFFDENVEPIYDVNEYVRKNAYPGIWNGPELFVTLLKNDDRATSNMVLYFYNRKFFIENNLFGLEDIRYVDDSMFSIFMAAERVMVIPDQLYLRRYREGSVVMSPMKKYYLESMIVLFLAEMQVWQSKHLDQELNRTIEKYFNMRQDSIHSFYHKFKNDPSETPLLNKNAMAAYFYKYFIQEVPLHRERISAQEIAQLGQADSIILYGAGYIATETAKILEYNHVVNYKVAITQKPDKPTFFRGRQVTGIEQLQEENKTAIVVVALSRKNFAAIEKLLEEYGFENILWITL